MIYTTILEKKCTSKNISNHFRSIVLRHLLLFLFYSLLVPINTRNTRHALQRPDSS